MERTGDGTTPGSDAPEGEDLESWAYETPLLEQGSVVMSAVPKAEPSTRGHGLRQQYFHKCMILALEHDKSFTKGIILNRPTAYVLDNFKIWCGGDVQTGGLYGSRLPLPAETTQQFTSSVSEDVLRINPRRFGTEGFAAAAAGDGGDTMADLLVTTAAPTDGATPADITVLHTLTSPEARERSKRVLKDLFVTSFADARWLVDNGLATHDDFWVFVGYAGWGADQLQGELDRGLWHLAAADPTVLLKSLTDMARDPDSIPRLDAATGELCEGGDGIGAWERLIEKIGRAPPSSVEGEGDLAIQFCDDMLREWVRTRLVPLPPVSLASTVSAARSRQPFALQPGTLLAVTSPVALDLQFLHKSLILVLDVRPGLVVSVVINRPTDNSLEFEMAACSPPQVQDTGGDASEADEASTTYTLTARRRVFFGGNLVTSGTGLLLLHRSSLQCGVAIEGKHLGADADDAEELAPMPEPAIFAQPPPNPGLSIAGKDFCGTSDDLLVFHGLTAWTHGRLHRAIRSGHISQVDPSHVDFDVLFDLGSHQSGASPDLQERIKEMQAKSAKDPAATAFLKSNRQRRVASLAEDVWRGAVDEGALTVPTTPRGLSYLADDALLEWLRVYTT